MQDMNTLKKSIKQCSFSDSIHGKGGMKPKCMGPNFCYTIESISFLRVQKTGDGAEWEKNDIIFTKFVEYYSCMGKREFKHLQSN